MKLKKNIIPKICLVALLTHVTYAEEEVKAVETPAEEVSAEPAVKLDFGDYSSQTLSAKAWQALSANDHAAVIGYTSKCIEMFEAEAVKMQGQLTVKAPAEKAHDYWALNDVSICYFIRAQSKEAQEDSAGAVADYQVIVDKLFFGQCWDTKGWFWSPSDAAKVKVKELAFDAED